MLIYIYKLSPVGFVIVSGNNSTMPILGYSFTENFADNGRPIQLDYLFNLYQEEISDIVENDTPPTPEFQELWDRYSQPFDYVQERNVAPLLTCNWNQDSPWNDMCPVDQDGPGSNVYAGCVAISMAQVMYYWSWPEIGEGDHGYNANPYGYQYANFGNTQYDYDTMEDLFATESSQLLIYHAGVAVNMGYSPDGSGAWVMNGQNSTYSAMRQYFRYQNNIGRHWPEDYSTEVYRSILKEDLDGNKPIIYVGCSNDGCHAWNIDGYDDNYFHNNFGWGGSNNGYYLLSSLNGFNSGQSCLTNLVPEELNEPHLVLMGSNYNELDGDGDGIVNPGESIELYLTVDSFNPWPGASNVEVVIESNDDSMVIDNEYLFVGSMSSGSSYTNNSQPFIINIAEDASLGSHTIGVTVMASDGYVEEFELDLFVSLFQEGFPFDTAAQVKTNPLIIDIDEDLDLDIIFSDNEGYVHVVESSGLSSNSNFPYHIGDDVWGSISSADIDLDGDVEFIVCSMDKHLYVFDKYGLDFSVLLDRYMIGTPVIGQVDGDPELEIIIGGFGPSTSTNPLFVLNHDGSNVSGFPIQIGEKIRGGVALADYNANGLDDIVFGTDSDNIYLIMDNGEIANGFPFSASNKIESSPSIIEINGVKIICVGSKDDHFYGISDNGNIIFDIETGGNISSSASFINSDFGTMIFFASEDGFLYAINENGQSYSGWPKFIGENVYGSPVFIDLDGDGLSEVLVSVDSRISINSLNGDDFVFNSIPHDLPLASSPTMIDIDDDGDLEAVVGTGTDLSVVDFKFQSSPSPSWNMFKGDNMRTSYYNSLSTNLLGDANQDGALDILDIVLVVNIAIDVSVPDIYQEWAADINSDGSIDVLDVILLVNIVLE